MTSLAQPAYDGIRPRAGCHRRRWCAIRARRPRAGREPGLVVRARDRIQQVHERRAGLHNFEVFFDLHEQEWMQVFHRHFTKPSTSTASAESTFGYQSLQETSESLFETPALYEYSCISYDVSRNYNCIFCMFE